ncbi:hypothetical protein LTR37_008990 [Vermiconidia calcicola]|uniref:Uncharacterized protein n=1 Tax=Vermiconidia calcicola TaxID=1690605 RepID=A0ACC3N9V9_9PEZI|nr:hypothetical protein LTR37_008990 [Vermiconidia calcicola]
MPPKKDGGSGSGRYNTRRSGSAHLLAEEEEEETTNHDQQAQLDSQLEAAEVTTSSSSEQSAVQPSTRSRRGRPTTHTPDRTPVTGEVGHEVGAARRRLAVTTAQRESLRRLLQQDDEEVDRANDNLSTRGLYLFLGATFGLLLFLIYRKGMQDGRATFFAAFRQLREYEDREGL